MPSRRKKKSYAGVILVMTLVILALIAFILYSFVFVVRDIRAEGVSDVPEQQLVRASGIQLGKSIFRVNEESVRTGINALGTVVLDGVRFRYPSMAILTVHTRTREAILLHQGSIVVLDGDGYVMEKVSDVPPGEFPFVKGLNVASCVKGKLLQTDTRQLEVYSTIIRALNDNAADEYVSEIDLADTEDLRITTRTGMDVLLGDASNMKSKIAWMKSAFADLEQRGTPSGTLDVSSGNKADFARKG